MVTLQALSPSNYFRNSFFTSAGNVTQQIKLVVPKVDVAPIIDFFPQCCMALLRAMGSVIMSEYIVKLGFKFPFIADQLQYLWALYHAFMYEPQCSAV